MNQLDTNTPVSLDDALIVEDDPALCLRMQRVLAGLCSGSSRATWAHSLQAAREAVHAGTFSLALVDIGLPDGNGIELIDWLHQERPSLPCVVVSSWGHEQIVLEALKAGAIGYLLKERDDEEITAALQCIQRGGAVIDPAVAKCILAQLQPQATAQPASTTDLSQHDLSQHESTQADLTQSDLTQSDLIQSDLTRRETEVLNLVARGYSNREIAELTSLSRYTVEDYTKRIYRKLTVGSRTAAVHEAKSRGLLQ